MLDFVMIGILLASFGLMKLFINWCGRQVDKNTDTEEEQ